MSNLLTEIKKSVSFIFVNTTSGNLVANGTGFFVGVKNEVNPNLFNVYFVTAKHVLKDASGKYFSEIFLRINTHSGSSEIIKIMLKDVKIFEHTDKDVDIVLFPFIPNQEIFDFKFIQNDLIASSEIIKNNDISEGDDIFFTGLFTSHIGQKKNQPIIRFGKVSLMSDEKIEWKEDNKPIKYLDLYLLECQSYGGNSGSPVFFQLNPMRNPSQLNLGGQVIFLAGLMTGSFLNANQVKINDGVPNLISMQNIGIAAVTPAYKLHEILFSEELITVRNTKKL